MPLFPTGTLTTTKQTKNMNKYDMEKSDEARKLTNQNIWLNRLMITIGIALFIFLAICESAIIDIVVFVVSLYSMATISKIMGENRRILNQK